MNERGMSTQNCEERRVKVVLLGRSGTGVKTSLMKRFVDDRFEDKTVSTLGVDLSTKTVTVGDTDVKLMIWGLRHLTTRCAVASFFTT